MQYLHTDEQTLTDLGIFSKPGKASIFDLYNRTVTQGGSSRLSDLFRRPVSDLMVIRERAAVYSFFSQGDYSFPLDGTTTGAVAFYLENNDVRTQLQPGSQSFGQRMKSMVAADAEHVFVQDGVQAVIRLFHQLYKFLKAIDREVIGSGFERDYVALRVLLEDRVFTEARSYGTEGAEPKLSSTVLADLDKLLRFTHRDKLIEILDKLYDLDVFIAVGQTARKHQFKFAEVLPGENQLLCYQQVYHPQVEKAIANDLKMDGNGNVLFLTGANMAGKSTLMKSIGIALYLAHMGFPVAAAAMRFSVRDGIYTSINLADNLSAGASHYYAEVLRVKEVAGELASGKKLFVIFDELFRGTNVKDAYDATIAITGAFARKSGSQFIISTHIMEAGEVLQEARHSIQYKFLPTTMQGNVPVYTRVLREGITADRQGMVIIENEGILEMLDKGIHNIK